MKSPNAHVFLTWAFLFVCRVIGCREPQVTKLWNPTFFLCLSAKLSKSQQNFMEHELMLFFTNMLKYFVFLQFGIQNKFNINLVNENDNALK